MNATDEDTQSSRETPGAAPPATHDSVPAGRENPGPHGAASREIGGRDGPDPTRYGDWEKAGRCIDF